MLDPALPPCGEGVVGKGRSRSGGHAATFFARFSLLYREERTLRNRMRDKQSGELCG